MNSYVVKGLASSPLLHSSQSTECSLEDLTWDLSVVKNLSPPVSLWNTAQNPTLYSMVLISMLFKFRWRSKQHKIKYLDGFNSKHLG